MSRSSKRSELAPRKNATQTRATKTVEAIVEAAARILETLGFEGYTTNAIAERAGVSIGSLYQYFPNKDAITLALIARESSLLLQNLRNVRTGEDWQDALYQMAAAAVRHQLRRPALARLIDIEECRLSGRSNESAPDEIYAIVQTFIAKTTLAVHPELDWLTADVLGMTRGMTNMAGQRSEVDEMALATRVYRAVAAYLSIFEPGAR